MLGELLGSRPAPSVRSGQVAASAAAHAVLIAAVLMATRGTSPHAHGSNHIAPQIPRGVQVHYLTSFPIERAGGELKRPARPATTARTSAPAERHGAATRLASLKASLDAITARLGDVRPAIDVAGATPGADAEYARWTMVADSEFNGGASRLTDSVPSIVPVVKNGIYTPDLVDEPVRSRTGNPKPRYPEPLRAAGVEADVNVQFVVDTTGRVDEPSIKFSTHIHELFMDAIRVSLRRARFFPARFAGSFVPQLVQQEFRFELRERP